jgi:hypothetical protein
MTRPAVGGERDVCDNCRELQPLGRLTFLEDRNDGYLLCDTCWRIRIDFLKRAHQARASARWRGLRRR